MPTNGMTIDSLNTVSSLTAQDEVPVWDKEASGEPTRKITAQNLTNSVKTLGSLVNTTEMNTAIAQSTATQDGTYNVAYIGGVAVTQSKLYCHIPFHNPSNKTNITINKFGVVGVWTDTVGVQYVAFDSKNKLGFSLIATAPSNVFAANGAYAVIVQFTVA